MKVTRVVEYEGTEEDLKRHLTGTLLSRKPVIVTERELEGPELNPGFSGTVTIRLVSETWE